LSRRGRSLRSAASELGPGQRGGQGGGEAA
jgi:hypothetical protein